MHLLGRLRFFLNPLCALTGLFPPRACRCTPDLNLHAPSACTPSLFFKVLPATRDSAVLECLLALHIIYVFTKSPCVSYVHSIYRCRERAAAASRAVEDLAAKARAQEPAAVLAAVVEPTVRFFLLAGSFACVVYDVLIQLRCV